MDNDQFPLIENIIDDAKPVALAKLEMLSAVRARVEDVVRVLGIAMDLPLTTPTPSSLPANPPPANGDIDAGYNRRDHEPRRRHVG